MLGLHPLGNRLKLNNRLLVRSRSNMYIYIYLFIPLILIALVCKSLECNIPVYVDLIKLPYNNIMCYKRMDNNNKTKVKKPCCVILWATCYFLYSPNVSSRCPGLCGTRWELPIAGFMYGSPLYGLFMWAIGYYV